MEGRKEGRKRVEAIAFWFEFPKAQFDHKHNTETETDFFVFPLLLFCVVCVCTATYFYIISNRNNSSEFLAYYTPLIDFLEVVGCIGRKLSIG